MSNYIELFYADGIIYSCCNPDAGSPNLCLYKKAVDDKWVANT